MTKFYFFFPTEAITHLTPNSPSITYEKADLRESRTCLSSKHGQTNHREGKAWTPTLLLGSSFSVILQL